MNNVQQMDDRLVSVICKQLFQLRLTAEEKKELDVWLSQSPHNPIMLEGLMNDETRLKKAQLFMEADKEGIKNKLFQKLAEQQNPSKIIWLKRGFLRYVAAAAILFIIAIGAYMWFGKNDSQDLAVRPDETPIKTDIAPGSDKATLILGDQKTIVLDNAQNGMIVAEEGVQVNKNDGRLNYDAASSQNIPFAYHTLIIPRKGKYQLKLPDGSEVWLNSDSKLRYPISFTGSHERKVELSGEAYFKVEKNAAKPFRVVLSPRQHGQETIVEAIGTEFNLNSYDDEPGSSATLIEGLVKVNCGNNVQMLKPNQQVVIDDAGKMHLNKSPQIDVVIGWKQGYFMFESLDVPTLMRQIRRWYDVDVEYIDKVPDDKFGGGIPRNINLSELISALKAEGLNIKFENSKIVIRG